MWYVQNTVKVTCTATKCDITAVIDVATIKKLINMLYTHKRFTATTYTDQPELSGNSS